MGSRISNMIGTDIAKTYEVEKILGNGKFGVVFLGKNMDTGERVAIKTESSDNPYKILKHEVTVLNYLYGNDVRTIPSIYWYGVHLDFRCIVMSYFSHSLQDYYEKKGALPLDALGSLMIKCIDSLSSIHKYYVLHRDIKPHNFMMRDGDIFVIDFGLSTYYMNGDGEHLERSDEENVIGSPRYISFYNHCGEPFSRRDDLISLGYMYMYLSTGTLPWDGIQRVDPPNISKTSTLHPMNISRRSLKTWTNLKRVADGTIKRYLKYCYGLEFDEDPDYSTLMELFMSA